jgi:hypothetical protein
VKILIPVDPQALRGDNVRETTGLTRIGPSHDLSKAHGTRVDRWSRRSGRVRLVLIAELESRIEESMVHAHEHLEDRPEIRDWAWTD